MISFLPFALMFAFCCFGAGLIMNLYCVVTSTDLADRILALDTMALNVIALIVLYGIYSGSQLNFEAALLFAMMGFISTVSYCKFILRGDIIE